MKPDIHIVLLSGGSGSRLWPLSNDARSKQFLRVLRDGDGKSVSMVQRTFSQLSRANIDADVTVATCESQVTSLKMQVEGEYRIVVEPERRDTAPAIMLSCMNLLSEQGASRDDSVIVMPIDSFAADGYFLKLVELSQVVQSGKSDLALLGVQPTYPSQKYGYILPEAKEESPSPVTSFVEKPEEARARELIERGALWNCGVFCFKLGYVLDFISAYGHFADYRDLRARYSELPKNSFDFEIVEKANSISVISYYGEWKDLGTWNTLTEEMDDVVQGNVFLESESCSGIHAINELGIPMVVAGIQDAVVVATPDGILVSDKETSAHIKSLVQQASEDRPMQEIRHWGSYRVIDMNSYADGSRSLTKEIAIKAGKQIEVQSHSCRSEVWTVVSGTGEFLLGNRVLPVVPGSVLDIPAGVKHAVFAHSELHAIEVQLGDVLVEDDAMYFGEYWN